MKSILFKATVFFLKYFSDAKNANTNNIRETLEFWGLKEFDIFFSPHLAANDDLPSIAVTSSIKDCFEGNPKIKMRPEPEVAKALTDSLGISQSSEGSFPTLSKNTLKHLGLLSVLFIINACAGVGGPVGGGGIDGGSSGGNGLNAPTTFGGGATGSGSGDISGTKDDQVIGDGEFVGAAGNAGNGGSGGYGGGGGNPNTVPGAPGTGGFGGGAGGGSSNTGGSNGGFGGGGSSAAGGGGGNSLPQSSIPPPLLKKKVNVYATDSEGNTPVIGSEGAVGEDERNEDHVVVISTDPLDEVVARVKMDKNNEMLAMNINGQWVAPTGGPQIAPAAEFGDVAGVGDSRWRCRIWGCEVTGSIGHVLDHVIEKIVNSTLALLNKTGLMPAEALASKRFDFAPDIGEAVKRKEMLPAHDENRKKEKNDNADESAEENNNEIADEAAEPVAFINEDGSGKTDLALDELCDGKDTVCCDTIQADGSFECYTRALPTPGIDNNSPKYHLYVLNKNDMTFSQPGNEPINNKLRWFRDVPKDIKANASGAYSLTSDISIELKSVDDVPLRVYGNKTFSYKKDDMVGATALSIDAQSIAYLKPQGDDKGVYTKVLGGAAGVAAPFVKHLPADLLNDPNAKVNNLKSNTVAYMFSAEVIDGVNLDNPAQYNKYTKINLASGIPGVADTSVSIAISDANGCTGFKRILGFESEVNANGLNTGYYIVFYLDNNPVGPPNTCSILAKTDDNQYQPKPQFILDSELDISQLINYRPNSNGQLGKTLALDTNKNKILVIDYKRNSNNVDDIKATITKELSISNEQNIELKSLTINKDTSKAYLLNKTADKIIVFDLRPDQESPLYLGDYDLKNAAIPDKDLFVKPQSLALYTTNDNQHNLVIGTQDLKGAIILPEEQILNADLDDSANLSFTAVAATPKIQLPNGAIPNDLGGLNQKKLNDFILNKNAGDDLKIMPDANNGINKNELQNKAKKPINQPGITFKETDKNLPKVDDLNLFDAIDRASPKPAIPPKSPVNRVNPAPNQRNRQSALPVNQNLKDKQVIKVQNMDLNQNKGVNLGHQVVVQNGPVPNQQAQDFSPKALQPLQKNYDIQF